WQRSEGRQAFVEFLIQHPGGMWQMGPETTPWEVFVVLQLKTALTNNDLQTFRRWLEDEPWVLQPSFVDVQNRLIQQGCWEKSGEPFIAALLDRDPALLHTEPPPPSSAIAHALSYGNAHLIPMLTRI